MGTTGAIWYLKGPLEVRGAGVQMDGGPEALGILAAKQRLKLEKLTKEHKLSRNEALNLLWSQTIGNHIKPTIWNAEWNYTITKKGLKITRNDRKIKTFTLQKLKKAHKNNQTKRLLNSATEEIKKK